jgi:hypothetical protein
MVVAAAAAAAAAEAEYAASERLGQDGHPDVRMQRRQWPWPIGSLTNPEDAIWLEVITGL